MHDSIISYNAVASTLLSFDNGFNNFYRQRNYSMEKININSWVLMMVLVSKNIIIGALHKLWKKTVVL